nr:class I SAM-dependent methyltransferase [uncultured Shinella sp.]
MAEPLFSLDGQSLITPYAVNERLPPSPGPDNEPDLLRTAEAEFAIVITIATQRLASKTNRPQAARWLIGQLHDIRKKFGIPVWQKLIPLIQAHPSATILQQCPFTRWSFEKPRGYSGDASLIDFIYGHVAVANEVARSTRLGLDIFEYTINAPGPVAVRERRDILTRTVDETAIRAGSGAEVLAIAAGHLREAETSTCLAEGRLKRWVALDQDPQSIASILRQFKGTAVEPIDGSVRGLLTRKHRLGMFDLIYAAGLYDYLTDRVAIQLTWLCLEMLKPGGVFLFANFSNEMADDGYMESYMNWTLIQRSEADMWRIANESAAESAFTKTVWFGANRNILYSTITKLA